VTLFAFFGAIEQGLVYGLMTMGVFMTFRVLDFPDLTVDGSLPLGAAVASVCIISGMNPFLALIPAMLAGFLAGMITGFLSTKLKILHLLASILTMTALYSINIRIMGGRPNISLLNKPSVFDAVKNIGIPNFFVNGSVFAAIILLAVFALIWLMKTEYGQSLIATGDNPRMITSLGVNTHFTVITGVGISNALVALSGGLIAQYQGTADVSMGVGTIVGGLASIVVGETLFGSKKMAFAIISVVLGSVAYRLAIALALGLKFKRFSFTASDFNLITASIVVIALLIPRLKESWKQRKRTKNA
jgi:putative ABC transport system permease protein